MQSLCQCGVARQIGSNCRRVYALDQSNVCNSTAVAIHAGEGSAQHTSCVLGSWCSQ